MKYNGAVLISSEKLKMPRNYHLLVNAWYMDDSDEDQRLEHHQNPPVYVSLDELVASSKILYTKIDVNEDGTYDEERLMAIRKERKYTSCDEIEISPTTLPDHDEKIQIFFAEHLHIDDEIRFVLSGSGFFDIRDDKDQWVRVFVETGDLLILPAGIYHRFTLDMKNYIKVMRLFTEEPLWISYNRPADDLEIRKKYVNDQIQGFPSLKVL